MENKPDYEQLYYDAIYENRKLKQEVENLKNEIQDINICRTKKNIDLQKYIVIQMERRRDGKNKKKQQ